MTKDNATRKELKAAAVEAIFAACGGDYTNGESRLGLAQRELIAALVWYNFAPDGGWQATLNRQIRELEQIDYTPPPPASIFDMPLDGSPADIIAEITHKFARDCAWDVESVDEYIASHQK